MLFFSRLSAYIFGTATALVVTVPIFSASALTQQEVDAVASQTTVVIGQGLRKGDIEARQEFNPGSGVFVAQSGKTYYVLTALHVVRTRGVVYGVRTSDGEVHFIDDEKTQANIIPFGAEAGQLGSTINGFDLAIVKFESNNTYPVATIGNSDKLKPGESLYVSGWPNPEDESVRRERRLSDGNLTEIIPTPFANGGYSVLYNNATRRGMSGGPVFNADGELVGIHGRGRAQGNEYCIDPHLSLNNSCGIQTIHFLTQAEETHLHLTFNRQPVEPSLIATGIENKPKADVIDNIFNDFTVDFVRSGVRDIPSAGCGTVLLGESCDNGI